jgi:hypothetical protein
LPALVITHLTYFPFHPRLSIFLPLSLPITIFSAGEIWFGDGIVGVGIARAEARRAPRQARRRRAPEADAEIAEREDRGEIKRREKQQKILTRCNSR